MEHNGMWTAVFIQYITTLYPKPNESSPHPSIYAYAVLTDSISYLFV
jgi:hypothetical protein